MSSSSQPLGLDMKNADCGKTASENGDSEMTFDPAVVKKLKLKTDLILLPILSIAYLFNSLARSNISNANTAGLTKDLHLQGNQFNQVLTYYQIPFIVFGPLVTMPTKQIGANITIPVMIIGFGTPSLATAFVHNFGELVACRVLVGVFESGFLASVIYYISLWYTRTELASRIGIFYAALTSSSAFGGLLAFGMFQLNSKKYFQWSYLFILEGSLSLFWAILTFLVLPRQTSTAWFLSKQERDIAAARLAQDSVPSAESKFNLKESFSEFLTVHGYIRVVISFVSGTILTSNANFLAMIVRRLGFSGIKTNLYTVAPALTGAVFLVAWCKLSDRLRERGFHMAASAVVSLTGYIVLSTIDTNNTSVLYFAMFLCTIGAYPATPIGSTWMLSNIPNLNARAMTSGLYISFGNCAGLLSSNIYHEWKSPRYQTSLSTNIGMSIALITITSSYGLWMRWENKCRDNAAGAALTENTSEGINNAKDPRFRFQV
uniref:Major facilitator superfamily (MFS) profile domain-containing protein n=1 Tax=Bionectria ochroleuca TaxID=29856 RepID=A0A0B7K8I7_BIOOC